MKTIVLAAVLVAAAVRATPGSESGGASSECNVIEYWIANHARAQSGLGQGDKGLCNAPTDRCADGTLPRYIKDVLNKERNCCPDCLPSGKCDDLAEFDTAQIARGGQPCTPPSETCPAGEPIELTGENDCCFTCKIGITTFFEECTDGNINSCKYKFQDPKESDYCPDIATFPKFEKCCLSCIWPPKPKCSLQQVKDAFAMWDQLPSCAPGQKPEWNSEACEQTCRFKQIAEAVDNLKAWSEHCDAEKWVECRDAMPVCTEWGQRTCDIGAGQCCCSCKSVWSDLKLKDALECLVDPKVPVCRLDQNQFPAPTQGGSPCPSCRVGAPPDEACPSSGCSDGTVCVWHYDLVEQQWGTKCAGSATLQVAVQKLSAEWEEKLRSYNGDALSAWVGQVVDEYCTKADAVPACADDDLVAASKAAIVTWVGEQKDVLQVVVAAAVDDANADKRKRAGVDGADALVRAALQDPVANGGNELTVADNRPNSGAAPHAAAATAATAA
eukprot:CAMPEP_0198339318 /NCGR_PEP_ID=MMETSP1450-20131203/39293_1 /TAXON_ID=753684 ORGANISM="Madagascaria erythrocladiodes, Strain CCMP3234" /NCGR_SAMPLE_ID=MMETSP1450 /ASSEMBLY_ACC=CAM_ASM_001115 /LENGTH=499 /DNA_ID=CAMNT_0044044243 /DNA_START=92 /DNA_END=1587 /DNA_ORIENTATION=+